METSLCLRDIWFMAGLQDRLMLKQTKSQRSAAREQGWQHHQWEKEATKHIAEKKEEHIDRFKLFLHTINTMHEFSFTCNAVCVHAICEGLLEDSSPLQLKMKQQKGGFRSMLLNAFCASLLGNLLPDKWVIWVGDGVIRARQDF